LNTRAKGRKFEKQEEKAWAAMGWETELIRPEARFIGPGKAVVSYRDFFHRYDLLVTSPKARITIFIQVSTESPTSSHKNPGPLGFSPPVDAGYDEIPVDEVMDLKLHGWLPPGTFEAFVQYKRDGRGPYKPTRTWWMRTLK